VNAEPPSYPWPAGSATGVGSMPGTDPAEALAVVLGELPDLPHLPELPGRGVGADLTGRTAALLVDIPVETTPRGWKLAARPGRDQRRAADLLSADLDALHDAAADWSGPFKIQVCGPWTLAATIEMSRSQNPALADPGAVADLIASLAVGAADATVTGEGLSSVLDAATAFGLVHCCARDIPFRILNEAGAQAVGFDLGLLQREEEQDALAEVVEAGLGILAGVVQIPQRSASAAPPSTREPGAEVLERWHRMGIPAAGLDRQVVLTPACGLAGASLAGARAALARCREAARLLPELIEEGAA
jgi:hypothetical protein